MICVLTDRIFIPICGFNVLHFLLQAKKDEIIDPEVDEPKVNPMLL